MLAKSYVATKLSKSGLAGQSDRVFGGLALAGIYKDSVVTASTSRAIDSLLQRLQTKLGTTAAPNGSKNTQKKQATIEKSSIEKLSNSQRYTDALLAQKDPATGETLNRIRLIGTTVVLHNPNTRVVYPIPGSKNVPAYV